jgi:ketosteroid isomerase-like protein
VDPEAAAVIRRGLELFNLGEYEASIATLPPEIEWDTSAAVLDGAAYRGRDEVLAYWHEIGERWDDFRIEADRWIDGDGVVLLLGRLIGRGVGSGVPVEHSWDQVWTVEGATPVRCENYSDREQAWRAAGLEPES